MTLRAWCTRACLGAVVALVAAGAARADGLDVGLRFDDGRLGVRLSGDSGGRDGHVWGTLELGRETRGDLGWGLSLGRDQGRRHRGWAPPPRDPRVRFHGEWSDRGSSGDWRSYYWDDREDGRYIGGRVRFVPRSTGRYGWDDRGRSRDYDPYPAWEERGGRDGGQGSDGGWEPYVPGRQSGDWRPY